MTGGEREVGVSDPGERSAPAGGSSEEWAADRPTRVAICVATCRRPQGLRGLLDGIDRQVYTKEPTPDLRVIVVENGAPGGASDVCAAVRPSWGWHLHYDSEPRLGIPYARNRALRCAGPWAEFIVFIDDDEVPEPSWLDELLHVQRVYGADVVNGALLRRYQDAVPDWMVRGGFLEPKHRPTGTRRERATTGNTLVRKAVFDAVGEFDERFALSGGSDTHFFLRARLRGFTIVWANEAVVYEDVPPGRATLGWFLRRSFRVGNTWSLCERDLRPGSRVRLALREVRKLARGIVGLPQALLSGKPATVHSLRRICEAAGNISGVFGYRYQEYRPSGWMMAQRNEAATSRPGVHPAGSSADG
jgi:glycosyltransferase involved in cell wall biosynthesis